MYAASVQLSGCRECFEWTCHEGPISWTSPQHDYGTKTRDCFRELTEGLARKRETHDLLDGALEIGGYLSDQRHFPSVTTPLPLTAPAPLPSVTIPPPAAAPFPPSPYYRCYHFPFPPSPYYRCYHFPSNTTLPLSLRPLLPYPLTTHQFNPF